MKSLLLLLVGVMMATASVGQSQEPKRGTVIMRVGKVGEPRAIQPEPDDKFEVDINGDLLIEHRRRSGQLLRQKIELATKINPEVCVHTALVGPSVVRYTYNLRNGTGALQGIILFAVAMDDPQSLSRIEAPPNWMASGYSLASWSTPSRYNWWSDALEGLLPNNSAGPFSFEVAALPGLTKLYLQGAVATEFVGLHEMSGWLEEQVYQATRFADNSVQPFATGPKMPLVQHMKASDVIRGIYTEVMFAINVPELRDYSPQLISFAKTLAAGDKAAAISLRPGLSQMGSSPLEKAFFGALDFDIAYLEAIP